jgi:hypothetical protein
MTDKPQASLGNAAMSYHVLHKAVSEMMSIFEKGTMLPLHERSYEVRLHTKGTCLTLVSYPNTGGRHTGHEAAESAKKYFIEEIAERLHELTEMS